MLEHHTTLAYEPQAVARTSRNGAPNCISVSLFLAASLLSKVRKRLAAQCRSFELKLYSSDCSGPLQAIIRNPGYIKVPLVSIKLANGKSNKYPAMLVTTA